MGMKKQVLPESFDFGEPSVELLKIGSKGLDKTASMQKRASAFKDVLEHLKPMPKRAYLHVITTGASQVYGPNCFVAGTCVRTSNGMQPIESLEAGTLVLTAKGRYRPILRTMQRVYTGPMTTLKVQGLPQAISMTDEHPVKVIKEHDWMYFYDKIGRSQSPSMKQFTQALTQLSQIIGYIPAELIAVGDHTLIPPPDSDHVAMSESALLFNGITAARVQQVDRYIQQEPIVVYNIQVEQDNSYCVPFAVHNCNSDSWVGYAHPYTAQAPQAGKPATIMLDGGLEKYHDNTYMKKAAVYLQHKTDRDGAKPSGQVVAAHYNKPMHRGQLIIAVNTDDWQDRLNKQASGNNIFLSVGADLPYDRCSYCLHEAHSFDEHCGHVKNAALKISDGGTMISMLNDAPNFYDISGVNVPADKMAYVLCKVASGQSPSKAVVGARFAVATRRPMPYTKAASLFRKLSAIQKQIICKPADDKLFEDPEGLPQDFIKAVENFPSDQIIDGCNRHSMLLSPSMLFKIIGKDSPQKGLFNAYADHCPLCGRGMMQDMEQDDAFPAELADGSYDSNMPVDLSLEKILKQFMPMLGMDRPAMNHKSIYIIIKGSGSKPKIEDPQEGLKAIQQAGQEQKQELQEVKEIPQDKVEDDKKQDDKQEQKQGKQEQKEQDMQKQASDLNSAFRRTYARYLVSFAAKNTDDTCRFAMEKVARINSHFV